MIITLWGHHGAGKSTLGERLAKTLNYAQYSTGGFMREMAMDRGISLIDLGREAQADGGLIDRTLDLRQIELGKDEDNFIIDGRLAFHFIPESIKIFLQVDSHEAARRIFHDESHGRKVESHASIDETAQNIEIRRKSEDERYLKYYGIHIYDMSFYDIVVDTTAKTPEQVFTHVIEQIQAKRNR